MNLTISDIGKDIAAFEAMIKSAQYQLATLPVNRLAYQENRENKIFTDTKQTQHA